MLRQRHFAAVPVVAMVCLLAAMGSAHAQSATGEAERLRNAGNFKSAAELLRSELVAHPDNGDAARLLGETLYWLKDFRSARLVYEQAIARHPEDTAVRLQYARMLAETRDAARARQLLIPLQQVAAVRADAETLLGTVAYWEGDVTTAQRLFLDALEINPDQVEAGRQLQEIRLAIAPWLRLASTIRHDDQPLDRLDFGVDAGWFATPLVPVTVRLQPFGFRLPDGTIRSLWSAETSVSGYIPAARLEAEAGGGVLERIGTAPTDWQGHAGLGLRVTPTVTLRGRGERSAYFYTTTSIDTPVMVESAAGLVQWNDPRGWLAESGVELQQFPDANTVRNAYAWLLAPLVHNKRADVQAGYAFSNGDADQSRFTLASPRQPYPVTDPRFDLRGVYDPYYTPSNLVTHSAIAAVTAHGASSTTFRVSGAYAVRATDQAPLFVVAAGQLQRVMYPRTFTPWNARTSLDFAVDHRITISLGGELGRTAFYQWETASLQLTYRFAGAAGRTRRP